MSQFSDGYRAIFGEDYVSEKYKMQAHNFNGRRVAGKAVCTRCGLVNLNNAFTQWSIKHGCLSELHPSYKPQRKKAGGI